MLWTCTSEFTVVKLRRRAFDDVDMEAEFCHNILFNLAQNVSDSTHGQVPRRKQEPSVHVAENRQCVPDGRAGRAKFEVKGRTHFLRLHK